MPRTRKDESTVPMLSKHRLASTESLDIEEQTSNLEKETVTEPYHMRNDSCASSWSCDTVSPSRKPRLSTQLLMWLRWGVVVGLQSLIIFLLCRRHEVGGEMDDVLKGKVVETGDDINGLYRTCKSIVRLPRGLRYVERDGFADTV